MICTLCRGSCNLCWRNTFLGKLVWSICQACDGQGVFNTLGPSEIKIHAFKPGKWRKK